MEAFVYVVSLWKKSFSFVDFDIYLLNLPAKRKPYLFQLKRFIVRT